MFHKKTDRDKLIELPKLKVASLDLSRSGRGLCYIDGEISYNLKLSAGDIIELIGKKKTAGIVVASFTDKGEGIIRIDETLRLNLGASIGEFITIRPVKAVPAEEIKLAPTKVIYDIKKQADIIKGKLIDKPIMSGDIIDISGVSIKAKKDNNPMNGFMRMLGGGGGSRRPTLGPLRLKVLNTKPSDGVVRFTRNTKIVLRKKVAFLDNTGNLVSSDDVGGLEKEISEIKSILNLSLKPKEKIMIEVPKGILLEGPSGIGKTLLAKVIANETEYNFISILPSDILHKYQGASENKLKQLFQEAEEQAPCLIFFDHIDALAPIIQREMHENARYLEYRIVTQLMELMDGIHPYRNVIVLGATHKLELIEPALLRSGRFDKIIHIPFPNLKSRAEIYKIHTRNIALDEEVSLMEIAKLSEDFTGADIKGVCQLAALNAVKREIPDFNANLEKSSEELESKIIVEKQDFLNAIVEITERLKK